MYNMLYFFKLYFIQVKDAKLLMGTDGWQPDKRKNR